MDGRVVFANLRDSLAYLYSSDSSARVVVDDAGLDATEIAFNPRAKNNWHAILAEAERVGKTGAVLAIALHDYPDYQSLRTVYDDYTSLIAQDGHLIVPRLFDSKQEKLDAQNRQQMLDNVKEAWIKGVLEESLLKYADLELSILTKREAVADPWQDAVRMPHPKSHSYPSGTRMIDVFEDSKRSLLVLGEPGSGKTTALLLLARDAIACAEKDDDYPIPVVFNLSTWSEKKQAFESWLVTELETRYGTPNSVAQSWVDSDTLMVLLDGLDEIEDAYCSACVEAINQFQQKHMIPLIVCSRTAEYESLSEKLHLRNAVVLQPLRLEQIDHYLLKAGNELLAFRNQLQHDPDLQKLAESPLMLNIMTVAYRDKPVEELLSQDSDKARRKQLFDLYVEAMFTRPGRAASERYTKPLTIHFLSWLAREMSGHSQTIFSREELQPTWLTDRQRKRYALGNWIIGVILVMLVTLIGYTLAVAARFLLSREATADLGTALIIVLSFALTTGIGIILAVRLPAGLAVLIAVALVILAGALLTQSLTGGLIFGLLLGLPGGLAGFSLTVHDRIEMAEALHWSWRRALWGMAFGLVAGLSGGIVIASVTDPAETRLASILSIAFPVVFIGFLTMGIRRSKAVQSHLIPNYGFRRSARYAVMLGSAVFLTSALVGVPIGILDEGIVGAGVAFGVLFGMVIGLSVALYAGGGACIQNLLLHGLLAWKGHIAWNLDSFLDHSVELIFLRRVGSGYIFENRLLMQYFAQDSLLV